MMKSHFPPPFRPYFRLYQRLQRSKVTLLAGSQQSLAPLRDCTNFMHRTITGKPSNLQQWSVQAVGNSNTRCKTESVRTENTLEKEVKMIVASCKVSLVLLKQQTEFLETSWDTDVMSHRFTSTPDGTWWNFQLPFHSYSFQPDKSWVSQGTFGWSLNQPIPFLPCNLLPASREKETLHRQLLPIRQSSAYQKEKMHLVI